MTLRITISDDDAGAPGVIASYVFREQEDRDALLALCERASLHPLMERNRATAHVHCMLRDIAEAAR